MTYAVLPGGGTAYVNRRPAARRASGQATSGVVVALVVAVVVVVVVVVAGVVVALVTTLEELRGDIGRGDLVEVDLLARGVDDGGLLEDGGQRLATGDLGVHRRDLALLVNAAYADATVRQLSTSPEYQVEVGSRVLQYNTTNRLVKSPDWDIGLQKTGYISEAGQCLVMQAKIAGRKVIMVFLDSAGKFGRIGDAERVRRWVEATPRMANPAAQQQQQAVAAHIAG